jgi:hypothetical protein
MHIASSGRFIVIELLYGEYLGINYRNDYPGFFISFLLATKRSSLFTPRSNNLPLVVPKMRRNSFQFGNIRKLED